MTLTPDQVKAGRELAGWSRLKLAARVNVCDETIRRYERGEGAAATLDLMMVRQILESAGVEFIAENGGKAAARLRKATAE
jgi:ribosome-binding protein aMBF1 (putative translation factor)